MRRPGTFRAFLIVSASRHRLRRMLADLIAEAAAAGAVRDDVAPDELSDYCFAPLGRPASCRPRPPCAAWSGSPCPACSQEPALARWTLRPVWAQQYPSRPLPLGGA